MKIKFTKNYKDAKTPTRAFPTDAGWDLFCLEDFSVVPNYIPGYGEDLDSNTPTLVDTGISIAIPEGYYGRVAEKSGLAAKGVEVKGGVIDSAFRDSIKVIMVNATAHTIDFERGQKIAQLIIQPINMDELEEVDSLEETDRGSGGFGSTGDK